jgi:hypothetical protein
MLLGFTASALPAFAQNTSTTITLSHLIANGAVVPYARVCASPADSNGNEISVSASGWGLALKSHPFCAEAVNGALPSGLPVPDSSHTTAAAPIRYNITIQVHNANGIPTGAPIILTAVPNINGPTYALDSYTPTVSSSLPPGGLVYTTGVPATCTSPSIVIDQTVPAAYMCNSGTLTPLAVATTATYAATAGSASSANTANSATTANYATTAGSATTATTATNASHASLADTATAATNATYATSAGSAASASTAAALATAPSNCGSLAATGINADGSPVNCIAASGGGATAAGSPLQIQIKAASGTGLDATNWQTDSTKTSLLGVNAFTVQSVDSSNTLLPIGSTTGRAISVRNFVQRNSSGTILNGEYPAHVPFNYTYTTDQRYGPSDGIGPFSFSAFINSGFDNTNTEPMNAGGVAVEVSSHTPIQLGSGAWTSNVISRSPGDSLGQVNYLQGMGTSRGEDEGNETHRNFAALYNGWFGGNVALGTPTTEGAQPMTLSNSSALGYTMEASERDFMVDVTKKVVVGNQVSSNIYASDNRMWSVTTDASLGLGTSTMTSLTNAVDGTMYSGSCGSQTAVGTYPSGDGAITNWQGVGTAAQNFNYNSSGALTGYCVNVASTAGLSAGMLVTISGQDFDFEYTTAIAVVDATHFTAFLRQPHPVGDIVTWGGGVGWGYSLADDTRPAHQMDQILSEQTAIVRKAHPILATLAGNVTLIYSDASTELASHAPFGNTPTIPLTITNPVVTGGVLTGITANDNAAVGFNNYTVSNYANGDPAAPRFLKPPVVTVSGCTVAPVIGFKVINAPYGLGVNGVIYSPYIASGGSGCPSNPTFYIPTTQPIEADIYPMAMVYRSEDQTNRETDTGNFLTYPILTSAVSTGDEWGESLWWIGRGVTAQESWLGDPYPFTSALTGPQRVEYSRGQFTGALKMLVNTTPTPFYLGSYANNYVPNNPGEALAPAPIVHSFVGQLGGWLAGNAPPLVGGVGPLLGGNILNVYCANDAHFNGGDYPCQHGIFRRYNWLSDTEGTTSIPSNLWVDPTTGNGGWGGIDYDSHTSPGASNPSGAWQSTKFYGFINAGGSQNVYNMKAGFYNKKGPCLKASIDDAATLEGTAVATFCGALTYGSQGGYEARIDVPSEQLIGGADSGLLLSSDFGFVIGVQTTFSGVNTSGVTKVMTIDTNGHPGTAFDPTVAQIASGNISGAAISNSTINLTNEEPFWNITGDIVKFGRGGPAGYTGLHRNTGSMFMVSDNALNQTIEATGYKGSIDGSTTGVTQSPGDNSTKLATTQYVATAVAAASYTPTHTPLRYVGTVTFTGTDGGVENLSISGLTTANHCTYSVTNTSTGTIHNIAVSTGNLAFNTGSTSTGLTVDGFCDLP